MNRTARTGKAGEAEAVEHLAEAGYEILERNFRCRQGELDVVARQDETLAIVEIKTRSALTRGLPREFVTPTKQRRILAATRQYCALHPEEDRPIRFDVVEVLHIHGAVAAICIIEDAFRPMAEGD